MNETDGIVREFLIESFENLEQADTDLVTLEASPAERSILDRVFRVIHTVKGTCSFLGFSKLEALAHAGENLLSRLRAGDVGVTPETTTALLSLVDAVRHYMNAIDNTGAEDDEDFSELIAELERLREGGVAPAQPPDRKGEGQTPQRREAKGPAILIDDEDDGAEDGSAATPEQGSRGKKASVKAEVDPSPSVSVEERHVRVDVAVLDRLMNLVGELVLTRNEFFRQALSDLDSTASAAFQRLNLVTTELQEGIMKTRMQPVGKIWGKFPRMVRDLARVCGKQVDLEMEGQDTELDRSLIEAIRDPLTHLVRNAIDHGIEEPQVRVRRGKPPTGRLWLRAFPEGGQVNIEIADDGDGINANKIKERALAAKVIDGDQAARLSKQEALHLVFLPGVSTARRVTNMSGRGVGMDVVKTNIERVNGMVDIESEVGRGTTIKIKIPLTLAIIPAVIVSVARERFAIPQSSVLELVRLASEHISEEIERIHGAPVYRLRGKLLPVVELRQELALEKEEREGQGVTIVVLQADNRQFGLLVDSVADSQEIVVKPLGGGLDRLPVFIGATIMGDGRVALILDVLGLAQRAHIISEVHERVLLEEEASAAEAGEAVSAEQVLLCSGRDDGRIAIPLERVARLETLSAASLEELGGHRVVQYRGDILALVDVCSFLPERRQRPRTQLEDKPDDAVHVVVYSYRGGHVGLIVERIIDIVAEAIEVQRPSSREGVERCAVIRGRVTEFLDVDGILAKAKPPFSTAAAAVEG
jgi:two-component system chemotaxis sensor kinase CheA